MKNFQLTDQFLYTQPQHNNTFNTENNISYQSVHPVPTSFTVIHN